ncbi:MAG: hypothetical protein ACOH2K_13005 [Burkholderiaceae bacterium]
MTAQLCRLPGKEQSNQKAYTPLLAFRCATNLPQVEKGWARQVRISADYSGLIFVAENVNFSIFFPKSRTKSLILNGAGDEPRIRDLQLGKLEKSIYFQCINSVSPHIRHKSLQTRNQAWTFAFLVFCLAN